PKGHFRDLVERLVEELGVDVVLVGGEEDVPYVKGFVDELACSDGVADLTGKLKLPELVELLKRSALYVGNDSSILHLAVALGVPTVSFFGPETPDLYGPLGDAHKVFYADLPCSPCLAAYNFKSSDCEDNICLERIGVEEVFDACRQMLAEGG
ncbi:MAG TPA: glycosyltransferase family 9 protein, partial [Proteobacteria bacterium]|nr:glycosyltransferase family 9 protein [Pseudomonadota bacterium]